MLGPVFCETGYSQYVGVMAVARFVPKRSAMSHTIRVVNLEINDLYTLRGKKSGLLSFNSISIDDTNIKRSEK